MTTNTWQRNYYNNFKEREKSLFMEMNDVPSDITVKESSYKSEVPQLPSFIQTQIQGAIPLQSSVLSLASRAYIDQSDVQPLTDKHACHTDECMKYHAKVNEREKENPYSPLKNFLLYLVVALLMLWIIIYTVFTKLKIL